MGPLSGQLIYHFLIAVFDAAVLSWLALVWYRRSMRALMRAPAPADPTGAPIAAPSTGAPARRVEDPVPPALRLAVVEARQGRSSAAAAATALPETPVPDARRRQVSARVCAAYIVGAGLHSAVVSALHLGGDPDPRPIVAWFSEWWINSWPIVPTLGALLALDRRASQWLAVRYAAAGCAALSLLTLAGQVWRGSFNNAPLTNPFWLIAGLVWTASVPLLLILVTGWRRIRAVTPMVLATTVVFAAAALVFKQALLRAYNIDAFRSTMLTIGSLASPEAAMHALFMLVSLPVGWLAWQVLRKIAASFERKRFSDLQLIVDCWWIIASANMATLLWNAYGVGALGGAAAAFAAYRIGVGVVLRMWPTRSGAHPPRLLLLRVFGYQARTEALYDRVAEKWRFHGPVHLIAGVDLATRTADPGDMLALIGGRLGDLYVGSIDDVPHRMAVLDRRFDPDGRYRINEVYCHNDTWRPTLQALLDASDGVLMDLRSFARRNAGCIFELEQIVRRVSSDRVLLVCDRTTDLELAEEALGAGWIAACAEGVARGSGQVAIVRVEEQSRLEISTVMRCLLAATSETVAPDNQA